MKNNIKELKAYYIPANKYDSYDDELSNRIREKKYYRHYADYINYADAAVKEIDKYAIDGYFEMCEKEEEKAYEKSNKMNGSYIYKKYKTLVYQSASILLMTAVIITGIIISKIHNPDLDNDNYSYNNIYDSGSGSGSNSSSVLFPFPNPDYKNLEVIPPADYDSKMDINLRAEEMARSEAEEKNINQPNVNVSVRTNETAETLLKKYGIKYISQIEEKMPNGCEVTSLAMILSRYIPNISPGEIVDKNYLPRADLPVLYNGVYIGYDPTYYYIGNPEGMGYGIFAPGLTTAAQNTIDAYKLGKTAANISGCSEKELFDYVSADYPVIVWCTMNLREVNWDRFYWHFPTGKIYRYPANEHCCVLVDYTDSTVRLYDPTNGITDCDRSMFLKSWNELGPYKNITRQAVIIK